MWHENLLINMVKLNIAIMRSIKTHSQINGDVLALCLIRMVSNHRKRLRNANERIEAKLNDKTPTNLKANFSSACDEWFERYKLTSGSKQSTITTKSYKVAHIKET